MLKTKPQLLAVLMSAALLAACGDSTTHIVEKEPIPVEDDHDHDEESGVGRLAISDKDSPVLRVYGLEDKELVEQFDLLASPEYLYASPTFRYALAVHRTSDKVQFIDGGVYAEDHGDHQHGYEEEPSLLSFQLSGVRPTHVQTNSSQVAIFNDGLAASNLPASAVVLTDEQIGKAATDYPVLQLSTYQHGAAQARGDYLLATLRDAGATGTLPDKVGLFHAHGDHYHDEEVFADSCPSLHGSAQTEDWIAFGCSDGVLLIEQDGDSFSSKKLANTADFTGTMRIGTLEAHPAVEHFVGIAGTSLFAVDAEHEHLDKIDWAVTTGATIAGYGFSASGEHFVLLDSAGYLSILHYNGHEAEPAFSLASKIQVATNLSAIPTGSALQLSLSAGAEQAFVLNPASKTLQTVELESAQISTTLELDYTPHKLVWLGVAGETEEHSH
ncbi:5-methyltetrahydrofolate--homocysteine methyltransferase [Rheinheimera sp.]|uniref:5-methyltetrahydrofolate--homocysteine methyltransferase n=1 Tax=Rheinheimera sp. TaxID=1869214 RepID=UPI00307CE6A0